MTHVSVRMIIAMTVTQLVFASAAAAHPATIEATFSFFGELDGKPIDGFSSFSGLGQVFFFNEFIENEETGEISGPFRRSTVSFDITDGDIHAAGTFSWACISIPGCSRGAGSFQYEDPIITTGFLEASGTFIETTGTMAFVTSLFQSGGEDGLRLTDAMVGATATQIVGEPSIFVLLTSAISVLGAIGVKRRWSA